MHDHRVSDDYYGDCFRVVNDDSTADYPAADISTGDHSPGDFSDDRHSADVYSLGHFVVDYSVSDSSLDLDSVDEHNGGRHADNDGYCLSVPCARNCSADDGHIGDGLSVWCLADHCTSRDRDQPC